MRPPRVGALAIEEIREDPASFLQILFDGHFRHAHAGGDLAPRQALDLAHDERLTAPRW